MRRDRTDWLAAIDEIKRRTEYQKMARREYWECDDCGDEIEYGILLDDSTAMLIDGETLALPDDDLCLACFSERLDRVNVSVIRAVEESRDAERNRASKKAAAQAFADTVRRDRPGFDATGPTARHGAPLGNRATEADSGSAYLSDALDRLGALSAAVYRPEALQPDEPDREMIDDEIEKIWDVIEPREWAELSEHSRDLLIEHIAARANYLQEIQPQRTGDDQIAKIFARLTSYVQNHVTNFIHGLALDHQPRRDSWRDDALRTYQRLREIAGE